jgi:hypothetical protein
VINEHTSRQRVKELLESLNPELKNLLAREGNWTKAVVGRLAQGVPQGLKSCAHGCERGEFLYDLIW